jgi:D-amino-acid dehydrogenase
MVGGERVGGAPRSAIVVGAGVVGLSTAWFLQENGVEVTVVDRGGVAAGASWGNAGWLAPALTIPLNERSVLWYGLRSMFRPNAPLHIPLTADPGLWTFLARFAMQCRRSSWTRAVQASLPLNEECRAASDHAGRTPVDRGAASAGSLRRGRARHVGHDARARDRPAARRADHHG